MKIDAAGALTLAAVIEQDLRAVDRLESHAFSLGVDPLQRAQLDSLGFALHNIYNALENSFTQISLSFENHVRDRVRWHRELLEKMFLELPPLRAAVLTGEDRPVLTDLLGFRHLFRHAYEFTLDASKTVALWRRWQAEGSTVKTSLATFAGQLRAVAAANL